MTLKDQAIQAMLLGDWQHATHLNKSLLRQDPQNIDALNRLAYAFVALGRIQEAKATYRKVLKLDTLNTIAIRNIKKLSDLSYRKIIKNGQGSLNYVNNSFIEESGKTKIISLVNLAPIKIIALLTSGQNVTISIKRSRIFVQNLNKEYLGMLPDDIGKRLIKLIKGGNQYDAYIKSVNEHNVMIFIKEIKRATRYKDHPSFLSLQDQNLNLSNNNQNMKNYKKVGYKFKGQDLDEEEVS